MTTVAAYCRISKSDLGLAVERQWDSAVEVATRHRLPEPKLYADEGVSASKPRKPGTAYSQLIADVEAGRITTVIVFDVDRLTRQPAELEWWLEQAQKRGIRLLDRTGELDSATPAGELFLRVRASVARFEVRQKSMRQKAQTDQRVNRGLPRNGSRRAFGLSHSGLEIVEAEAAAIRWAFEHILSGGTIAAVVREWTRRGLTSPLGKPWYDTSVRKVLMSPTTAGVIVHRGQPRWDVDSKAPAIVPLDVWKAVTGILSDPGRVRFHGTEARLLTGIGICGVCRAPVGASTRPDGKPTIRCREKHCIERVAAPVEEYVVSEVLQLLHALKVQAVEKARDVSPLRTERSALAVQRGQLADDLTLPTDILARRVRALDTRIAAIDEELAEQNRGDIVSGYYWADPDATWKAMTGHERRNVIAAATESIVIGSVGKGGWKRPVEETVSVVLDPKLVALLPRIDPFAAAG